MNITSYLTFNGNCREAMTFYRSCLGGQLHFQTVAESPLGDALPAPMRNAILHATLTKGELLIMASDLVCDDGLKRGNAISLMLNCNSEKEIKKLYELLSFGGQSTNPLKVSFWGALCGDLVDKYGNHWLLHYEWKCV